MVSTLKFGELDSKALMKAEFLIQYQNLSKFSHKAWKHRDVPTYFSNI